MLYIQDKEEEYKFADYRVLLGGEYILHLTQAVLKPIRIDREGHF